jgi:riboflavin synthase
MERAALSKLRGGIMFTGLVEAIGTIAAVENRSGSVLLTISRDPLLDDLKEGDSVAVDGVCLTVTASDDRTFSVEASRETVRTTTLGTKKPGQRVHLERALSFSGRLGGHLVTGHVDEQGKVVALRPEGRSLEMTFQISDRCIRYVVEKGSVAIDGVSLTVNEVRGSRFTVMIIDYTAAQTVLAGRKVGDAVNIETDIIGKYVERLSGRQGGAKIDAGFLAEHGFS